MDSTELQETFNSVFGWLDQEAVVFLFLGVGICITMAGLMFLVARPRAMGLVLTLLGLWMVPHAWLWYAQPRVMVETALIIPIISMAIVAALVRWAASKPTAHEFTLNLPLRMMSVGLVLLTVFHAAQYVLWKFTYDISYLTFGVPITLLTGAFCVLVGVVFAFYARVRVSQSQR